MYVKRGYGVLRRVGRTPEFGIERKGASRSAPTGLWGSLPLYGAWRFARDVQGDAVDAGDLVDDAVGDALEEVVGETGPVGGHGVVGGDGPDDDRVGVGSGVAHHADGVDGRQNGEAL